MDLLKNIISERPKNIPLMGMDIGKKTIGIAISDSSQKFSFPICTIRRTKFSRDIREIEKIIREYDIGGYVLGYPLNMDSSAGAKCQSIRDFGLEFMAQLTGEFKINGDDPWVALWDERLSTATVECFISKAADISRRKAKEKGVIDKLAAQHILQGALDYIQR